MLCSTSKCRLPGSHFLSNYRDDKAFALVSEVEKSSPPTRSKMWIAMSLGISMIAVQVRCSTVAALACTVGKSSLLTKSKMWMATSLGISMIAIQLRCSTVAALEDLQRSLLTKSNCGWP
eukprot:1161125-Pelagomonas_calceolata.AAC.6